MGSRVGVGPTVLVAAGVPEADGVPVVAGWVASVAVGVPLAEGVSFAVDDIVPVGVITVAVAVGVGETRAY